MLEQVGENQEPNEWGDPQQVPSLLCTELPHMVVRIRSRTCTGGTWGAARIMLYTLRLSENPQSLAQSSATQTLE